MTNREAILATIHKKQADRIPFLIRWWYLPAGEAERQARNNGLGLNYVLPCMYTSMPHVKLSMSGGAVFGIWGGKKTEARVTYETPVGTVWSPYRIRAFAGAMQDLHDYEGITSYLEGKFVKEPEDWRVLQYMAEDMEFEPFYNYFEYFKHLLGDEGVVFAYVGYHSPYLKLLVDWVGATRLYIDHAKYPDKVESVLQALAKSYEKQYPIGANAPADIVKYGDHIDDKIVSPRAFERYVLPAHTKFARMAHDAGKITAIHCDGRLNGLKHLIARLEHDVIHAITPPPVGNLPISEALDLWKDKVLWINYEYHFMGPDALKKHLLELLRSIIPGYRVIMDASTERWVPTDCLQMFVNIMSKVTLPLTEEKIEKIEKSL
jgi:hypothetical protein